MIKRFWIISAVTGAIVFSMLLDSSCTWQKEKDLVKPVVDTSSAPVTYTKDIEPIFTQNCIVCHSSGGSDPSVDYTTYEGVKLEAQSGKIMERIILPVGDSNHMPQGGPMLPQATINKIQKWIDGGCQK